MKSSLKYLAAFGAACVITVAALAADATGTWKWTQQGRGGGAGYEQTLKLEAKDGKLTGTLVGATTPNGTMPDVAIVDGKIDGDNVSFSVAREFNGNKFVTKYEGKVDGDTIKGSTERPGRNGGEPMKRDWTATRAK